MTAVARPRGWGRWLLFVAVLFVMAALFASGWWAAQIFVSPEQRAADASPPLPLPVTVRVESSRLVETTSASGTVASERTEAVPLSVGDCDVVTAETLVPGAVVEAGTVLTEVCGRPVVGLPGEFKYYRDLWPGMSGPDVKQLQTALVAAGFDITIDGHFGPATRTAVRHLYEGIGYSVPVGQVPGDDNADTVQVEGEDSSAPAAPRTDTYVPASELAALPSVEMTSIKPLPTGSVVAPDTTIDLASGGIVTRVNATEAGASAVTEGMLADVSSGASTVPAVVTRVANEETADGTKRTVTLEPVEGSFPQDWLGSQVVVVFVILDAGEHQLVVPSTAISFASDGGASVLRQSDNGTFEIVKVAEIATVAGRSAIRPVDGELNVDDVVAVR